MKVATGLSYQNGVDGSTSMKAVNSSTLRAASDMMLVLSACLAVLTSPRVLAARYSLARQSASLKLLYMRCVQTETVLRSEVAIRLILNVSFGFPLTGVVILQCSNSRSSWSMTSRKYSSVLPVTPAQKREDAARESSRP